MVGARSIFAFSRRQRSRAVVSSSGASAGRSIRCKAATTLARGKTFTCRDCCSARVRASRAACPELPTRANDLANWYPVWRVERERGWRGAQRHLRHIVVAATTKPASTAAYAAIGRFFRVWDPAEGRA